MTSSPPPTADPAESFVESTRGLVAGLGGEDPDQLERHQRAQLASFEALRSMLESGEAVDPASLARAVEAGRFALHAIRRRMQDARAELLDLRTTRARTRRQRAPRASARFVSRRV